MEGGGQDRLQRARAFSGSLRPDWMAGAVAAVATAAYLSGGPVWDDHSLIFGHLGRLDAAGLAGLWVEPVGGGAVGAGYFRPVAMTLLALGGRLAEMLGQAGDPVMLPLHLLTTLCHAASAVLLVRILGQEELRAARPGRAFVAALIFALHPLAAEVLGWASALPDALAVALGLAGVLAARRSLLLAGILSLLAMLSKETGLLFLPIFLLAGRAPRRAGLAWAGAALAWAAARVVAGAGADWSVAGKLELLPAALLWPVSSLLAPWPLTAVRDLHVAPAWVVPVGGAVLVLLFGLGLLRRDRQALAGALLAVAAPVLALPPTLDGYLAAERYAYPALAGLSLWAAAVLPKRLPQGRPLVVVASLLLLVVQGVQSERWTDDAALFTDAVRTLPDSAYAWHFLGQSAALHGDWRGAAQAHQRALDLPHHHHATRPLLVQALVLAGDPQRALSVARAGPTDGLSAAALAWWARAAAEAGDPAQAARLLRPLRQPTGWAGPPWVADLAGDLGVDGP